MRPHAWADLTRWGLLAALAGLVVVILVAGYFFARSLELEQVRSLAENDAIARGIAAFIEAREDDYKHNLLAYAGRFDFREAVARRHRPAVMVHLRQLHQLFPEMDRVVLADTVGVVLATYPAAPEIYGRSFADRDWFRGVSREWRPYMSEVFEGAAARVPIVILAVPIRAVDGRVIGVIGSGQRLEVIRQWLVPIEIPEGDFYVVDRKGQLVFHRTRVGRDHLLDYVTVPVVRRLLRGEEGVAEAENPIDREVRLSAYRLLPSLGWGLVVQRSKNLALERTRSLIFVSGAAGFVLTAALAFFGGLALRNQRRTERAHRALEEKNLELRNAQEELVRKERLAILGQLAGGVAHELRNPLGVVKNSVYYLKMVLPEEERVRKHLQILEREVGTAGRIVTDLLDFARVRPPVRAATDLSGLVGAVLERTPIGDHIDVLSDLAADLPSISVDPEQVGQILANLVLNAAQAMPEGGTLTIETARENGGVRVTISDTGVGIPLENLGKIFQPLFTTKAKGIGLGLAVAKSLAEANGGAISVASAPGQGSRFVVHFARGGEET